MPNHGHEVVWTDPHGAPDNAFCRRCGHETSETEMQSSHPHLDALVQNRPTARDVMLWLLRGGVVRWYSLSGPTYYDERINDAGRAEYRNAEGKWNDRMLDRHGLTVQSDTFVPARLLIGPTSIGVRPFGVMDADPALLAKTKGRQ